MLRALAILTPLLLLGRGAQAGVVDTPQCRRDPGEADGLIPAIAARENGVRRGDMPGLCRLLRQNETDMARARGLRAPCLTGRDLGENIGPIDASLEDIRVVLQRNCR